MPGIDQAQSIGGTGLDGTHVVWPADDDADGTMEAPQSQDGWWFRCGSSAFHCFFSTLRGWVSHSRS